jgi:hypothetical protein
MGTADGDRLRQGSYGPQWSGGGGLVGSVRGGCGLVRGRGGRAAQDEVGDGLLDGVGAARAGGDRDVVTGGGGAKAVPAGQAHP